MIRRGVTLFVFILTFLVANSLIQEVSADVGLPGDSCGDMSLDDINNLWSQTFTYTPPFIQIYRDGNGANCTGYVAYALEGETAARFIYSNLAVAPAGKKNVWKLNGFEGKYKATTRVDTVSDYISAPSTVLAPINQIDSFSEAKTFFLGLAKGQGKTYTGWDMIDQNAATAKFQELIKKNIGGQLSLKQEHYEYSNLSVTHNTKKTSVNATYKESYIFTQKASVGIRTVKANYEKLAEFPFTKNISNFVFKKGNGTQFAFDFKDHVDDVTEAKGIGILYLNTQNNKGQYLKYSIKGTKVYFTPNESFSGTASFRAYTVGEEEFRTHSNQFKVSIQSGANKAPILLKPIPNIIIPKTGTYKLLLKTHFKDPEGKKLTYRSIGKRLTTISFIGDIATISAQIPYDGTERIQLYANDGTQEIASNTFHITYEGGAQQKDERNTTRPRPKTNLTDQDIEPKKDTKTEEKKAYKLSTISWIIIIITIIFSIGMIGLFIWLYLQTQKKKNQLTKQIEQLSKNKVSDYIGQINEEQRTNGN